MIRVRSSGCYDQRHRFTLCLWVTGSKHSPLVKKKSSNPRQDLREFSFITYVVSCLYLITIHSPHFHKSHDTYGTISHMFTIDHRNFFNKRVISKDNSTIFCNCPSLGQMALIELSDY